MSKFLILFFHFVILSSCNIKNPKDSITFIPQPISYEEKDSLDRVFKLGFFLNDKKVGLWRTFDTSGLIIKAVYYENGDSVASVETNDLVFTTLALDHYSINVPYSWSSYKNYKGFSFFTFKGSSILGETLPTIAITEPTQKQGSLMNHALNDTLGLSIRLERFRKICFAKTILNSQPAILHSYSFNKGIQRALVTDTYVEHENSIYKITCISDFKDNKSTGYPGVFQLILDNIEFHRESDD